ncbi:hypothetical protein B0H19DRAFT_1180613 [Mycena capillaripes]|nr:hypothetical protein B0H19DRAFT_1180613 [Mycena capillaripes]
MRGPTVFPFPWSLWSADLRVKLAIVGVCKSWHQIGVELLYESVTICRLPQIHSLLSTLKSRVSLRRLVRRFHIGCRLPYGFCDAYKPKLREIFKFCIRLSHFGFSPAENPLWHHQQLRRPLVLQPVFLGIEPNVGQSITSLDFTSEVGYVVILPILDQLYGNLRSLALPIPDSIYFSYSHPPWSFEHLVIHRHMHPDLPIVDWLMPRLRRVWLLPDDDRWQYGKKQPLPSVTHLAPYCRTIKFLSLCNYITQPNDDVLIQDLLDRSPALQHIALNASFCNAEPLRHQKIQWVDVFCPDGSTSVTFESFKGLPALQTLRTLEDTMSILQELPAVLPSQKEISTAGVRSGWVNAIMSADTDSDILAMRTMCPRRERTMVQWRIRTWTWTTPTVQWKILTRTRTTPSLSPKTTHPAKFLISSTTRMVPNSRSTTLVMLGLTILPSILREHITLFIELRILSEAFSDSA